jgi:sodium-coupled neutral amino acid transporter 11
VIIALTASVLLPLCSLKSLSVLSPFSLLGLGGTLYTAVFMAIRFFDKSYFAGGKFFELIAAKPSFNARGGYTLNYLTLVLLSMLSTSYIAHYNAPQFYNELTNNTMARFNTLVGGAFGAAIVFFIFIMSIGFLTFGGATSGFILNNYASQDQLATLARFAIGLALLTGYPFTFSALREGLLDIMGKKDEAERKKYFTPLTWSLLAGVTALALVLKDVGFVVSITGALFGCFLMFIVPAVMNLSNKVSPLGGIEKLGNLGMIGTGVVMGVLGVYVSVARQLGKL